MSGREHQAVINEANMSKQNPATMITALWRNCIYGHWKHVLKESERIKKKKTQLSVLVKKITAGSGWTQSVKRKMTVKAITVKASS